VKCVLHINGYKHSDGAVLRGCLANLRVWKSYWW